MNEAKPGGKKHSGLLMLACNFSIKSKWPKCERLTIPQAKENKAIRILNRPSLVVCAAEPLRVVMVTSGGQAGYREFCGYSPKICSHPALRTGKKKANLFGKRIFADGMKVIF